MPTIVLIVDDHDSVRVSLRAWLETVFPQCHVIEAASGEEAVALAKANLPHLVVMDIGLPNMNGIEATRCIKACVPSAQIVVLTIHEDDLYRADAEVAGASAFVPKRRMRNKLIPTLVALLPATDGSTPEEPRLHGAHASFLGRGAIKDTTVEALRDSGEDEQALEHPV